MVQMRWIAMLLATAVLVGCQTSATEDAPPPRLGSATANPGHAGGGTPAGGSEGPLRLDSAEAAALLGIDDEPPPAVVANADAGKRVDNSRCLVCHGNFADEELSVIHAANGVGCERCHGPCNAHCSDENNITPPDVMYPRDSIVKACMVCHPADKLSNKEHHWDVFAPKDGKPKKVCSECHSKHRIATRDVRWNKTTRELIRGGWMDQDKK